MRIKLTIEYDGTLYSGWQIQENAITVQQVIEVAISSLTKETVKLTASGRTDAGVHALGQVAHFDTNSTIPPEKFKDAINSKLPNDIRIKKSELVGDDFSAMNSAKKKTYEYRFYLGEYSPLNSRYAFCVKNLDIPLMKKAVKRIVGTHDFEAFSVTGSPRKTTVRTIYKIKIEKKENFVSVFVTGNGFLYNMVRLICGALKAVSDKKITASDISKILETKKRPSSVIPLPANGLTLVEVNYD